MAYRPGIMSSMAKLKNGNLIRVLAMAALIACWQSCRGEQPTTLNLSSSTDAQGKKRAVTLAEVPARFSRMLVGTIDNKLAIQMELNRNKENLYGRYFYERKRDGLYLGLSGTVEPSGTVKLEEFDGEKTTGYFTGNLVNEVVDGESTLRLKGVWATSQNAAEKEKKPFELAERHFDLGGLKFISKDQSEELKPQRIKIDATHPELTGSNDPRVETFNKEMRDYIAKEIKGFKDEFKVDDKDARPTDSETSENTLDIHYEVAHADKDLISITYTGSSYTGGAHGNSASVTFNYDLSHGRMLALSDLFMPNSKYLGTIADYCIKAIERRKISDPDWIRKGAEAKEDNYGSWNILPQGLSITFDAYQVAAYAAGAQEIVVPYSALKGVIKPDGPLAAFAK